MDARRAQRVNENQIGDAIIAAAMKVHSAVGPGLLESAYETCVTYELEKTARTDPQAGAGSNPL